MYTEPTTATTPNRDAQLWTLAQERAKFKSQLVTFGLVNVLVWTVWFVTGARTYGGTLPWPVWATAFWGLGLLVKGLSTYGFVGEQNWSEREYEHLVRERENRR